MSSKQSKKTAPFTNQQVQVSAYMKALAHPVRLAILELLARQDSCVNGAIVQELPVARSTTFQHLKLLEKMGLIKSETKGAHTYYCIDHEAYQDMVEQLAPYLNLDVQAFDCTTNCAC